MVLLISCSSVSEMNCKASVWAAAHGFLLAQAAAQACSVVGINRGGRQ